jgi:hypothetical protein
MDLLDDTNNTLQDDEKIVGYVTLPRDDTKERER